MNIRRPWLALALAIGIATGCGDDAAPATTADTGKVDGGAPDGDGPRLGVTESGPPVKATTTGFADTVVGPIDIGGAKYTLTIPAVAAPAGIEVTMTPVTVAGSALPVLGAVKLGPSGTTFRVPAVLRVEGLAPGAKATALLGDDGTNPALKFAGQKDGVTQVAVPHFSIATIVEAANADAEVGAAGIASIPRANAGPLLADALNTTVNPAIASAGNSLTAFVLASTLFVEWQAAVQARDLDEVTSPALGGKTFTAVIDEARAKVVAAGQKVLLDLSSPACKDGTGQLSHPNDWFGALGWIASEVRLFGGNDAVPNEFAPCLDIALDPAVLSQGGTIPITKRALPVAVGLVATTRQGIRAPMKGTYVLDVNGGQAPDTIEPTTPALVNVDVDRGAECNERTTTPVTVKITGALAGTLGLANLKLAPAVSPVLSWTVTGDVASCPPPPPALLFARGVSVATQGLTRVRRTSASAVSPTFGELWTKKAENDFHRQILAQSIFKPFTSSVSDSKPFSLAGDNGAVADSGSLTGSAASETESFSIDGTDNLTGGSASARTSCTNSYSRPAVDTCTDGLPATAACADALSTGVYDNDLGIQVNQARRFILSGTLTATGKPVATHGSRASVRITGTTTINVAELIGGDAEGNTRSLPFSHDVVLQPGGYTIELKSLSSCAEENARNLTRTFPASVALQLSVTTPP